MYSLELLDRGTDNHMTWIGPNGYTPNMCKMTLDELIVVMRSFSTIMLHGEELRIMKLVE